MVEVTLDDALRYLAAFGTAKDLAVARLKNQDTRPAGSSGMIEENCDLLIPLILQGNTEIRTDILKGWRQVFADVTGWLERQPEAWNKSEVDWIQSLCRVAEIAHPQELRNAMGRLLSAVLDVPGYDEDVFYTVLSAWRSYERTKADLELVEQLIQKPNFAAAAFQMLLDMDSRDLVEQYLQELWIKHYSDNWPVDVPFMALLAEKKSENKTLVPRVLRKIKGAHPKIHEEIMGDLRTLKSKGDTWAGEWLGDEIEKDIGVDLWNAYVKTEKSFNRVRVLYPRPVVSAVALVSNRVVAFYLPYVSEIKSSPDSPELQNKDRDEPYSNSISNAWVQ